VEGKAMRAVIFVAALLISSAITPGFLEKDKAFSLGVVFAFFFLFDVIELIVRASRKP
jgi:hypothetical protein